MSISGLLEIDMLAMAGVEEIQSENRRMESQVDWTSQRVIIIGAARQGLALARYLVQRGARVLVNDRQPLDRLTAAQEALAGLPVDWVGGDHPLSLLDGADLVYISGGVPVDLPLVVEAVARGIPVSNDSQLFLEAAQCTVIGITGSAGKTTTTSLVGQMAQEAVRLSGARYRQAWIGGNIGSPLIAELSHIDAQDLAVMELSSFQLEIMTRSPQVAAILNITPNHLDRHKTMQVYTAAKARILEYQSPNDVAVLGSDDPGAWSLTRTVRGRLVSFGFKDPSPAVGTYIDGDTLFYSDNGKIIALMPRGMIRLRGEHNLLNVLAASAIALAADLPVEAIQAGVARFTGVPHRLEFVRTWGGADWYNDSIATAPERAIAAIRSFDEPLLLLAGGRDKDLLWEDFARLVVRRVRHVILFGEAATKINSALELAAGRKKIAVTRCKTLEEAVGAAANMVQPGDVVLLSPGGTSFDEFRDFEERGERFRQWVKQL